MRNKKEHNILMSYILQRWAGERHILRNNCISATQRKAFLSVCIFGRITTKGKEHSVIKL